MCKECKRIQSCISLIMGLALGICTLPILPLFASSIISTAVYSSSIVFISPFIYLIPNALFTFVFHTACARILKFLEFYPIMHFAYSLIVVFISTCSSDFIWLQILRLNVMHSANLLFKPHQHLSACEGLFIINNATFFIFQDIKFYYSIRIISIGKEILFNNLSLKPQFLYSHLVSSHLVSYICPLNINFYWNNGFLISFFFIGQLSSGIILSTSYTSDVTFAYYSILSLIREIYSGWCFRYIHSQGASFIFVLYFLHIARAVVYSSCLFLPSTWFSGIWLFIFLILIAFIGYLLPWGMLSFWGATVITNILSFIPLLIEIICGGYFISTSTLKRFFVIHFALPFLSFYLIFIHLFYLHLLGSNNPLGANINNKIPFFPFLISKDFFGCTFSMLIFVIQTLFGLLPLSHPDNATAGNGFLTPLHILPEWYFLPFYAILKAIPNKNAGFIILFYFSFYLFLSIFGSAGLNRSLSHFSSIIYFSLALGWIGCQLPQEKFISYGRIFLSMFALYVLKYFPFKIL